VSGVKTLNGEIGNVNRKDVELVSRSQIAGADSPEPATAEPTGFRGLLAPGRRRHVLMVLAGICLISLYLLFHYHLPTGVAPTKSLFESLKEFYKATIPLGWRLHLHGFQERFLQIFANPYYYLGVAAVFALQWLAPAKKGQGIFTVGLAQDFLYYFFGSMVLVYAAGPYLHFLDRTYAKHLAFLTIPWVAGWPFAIRAVFGLVFHDLLHWTHHFLRHKIKPLWYFHMIHHSQREMNLFTDVRSHFVELFFAATVIVVPLNMFSVAFANHGWLYFVPVLYFRLYHANIRTNLGPLKYILVTPQSHRIHHSIEEKHWDKNYGFIFTIWDHVFGTQYKNYDEYPDTGVAEVNFPREDDFKNVLKIFFVQLLYPFRRLVEGKS
jgi:sterol desaturase/sphingolipid hydroxylase (fatty acid hydroxylase superfamily)